MNNVTGFLIHYNIYNATNKRLKSRQPIWSIEIGTNKWEDMWKNIWEEVNVNNEHLISNPTKRIPCFDCLRAMWNTLNKIRTEQDK